MEKKKYINPVRIESLKEENKNHLVFHEVTFVFWIIPYDITFIWYIDIFKDSDGEEKKSDEHKLNILPRVVFLLSFKQCWNVKVRVWVHSQNILQIFNCKLTFQIG